MHLGECELFGVLLISRYNLHFTAVCICKRLPANAERLRDMAGHDSGCVDHVRVQMGIWVQGLDTLSAGPRLKSRTD